MYFFQLKVSGKIDLNLQICLSCPEISFMEAPGIFQKMMMMMMMIKVMITAVIVQVTLPLFSYFFFYMTFLLLPISLPTCSILFYIYFPIYFASSFPLPYMMVPSWLLYISSGVQSHDFFFYCLGQILHSVTPVSLRCDANEIELHQHRVVQLCKKQSPYLFNALIYFFVL